MCGENGLTAKDTSWECLAKYWRCKIGVLESSNGLLARYVKLRVAHAPGMPGPFFPPPTSKETASYRSRHESRHVRHARAVMHVGIDNMRWRGKRSRHSRRMRNPSFYVSGKRPMELTFGKRLGSCVTEAPVIFYSKYMNSIQFCEFETLRDHTIRVFRLFFYLSCAAPWILITMTLQWQWTRRRLKLPASRLFAQLFVRAHTKENIKITIFLLMEWNNLSML